MNGAIPPLPQYAFMAWYLVKAQGQLYLYLLPVDLYEYESYLALWEEGSWERVAEENTWT
jgi:hypothetical protein